MSKSRGAWSPMRSAAIGFVFVLLPASLFFLQAHDKAPDRVPSYVSWTPETIAAISSGDAFRGSLLAKRCAHCHGDEGFSPVASTPNLAAMDQLVTWKQLEDFRSHKRRSEVMEPIAQSLAPRDEADLAVYYAKVPVFADFQDNRAFPQSRPVPAQADVASHLISFGDGERGIPPCQACHGPVAYRPGAASLMMQNGDYVLDQLEAFANSARANDINEPMRTIASLLTKDERRAIAQYYGAGLGLQPVSSIPAK